MEYSKRIAKELMFTLRAHGINTKLIGSVKEKESSSHDIDLVVLNMDYIGNELIDKLNEYITIKEFIATDNGGLFVKTYEYGNLDFFPKSFLKSNCRNCKKECCCGVPDLE